LTASNLVIAAGLLILAAARGVMGLAIAWTVLGIGIGMGLYDPAFAALTWLYGRDARRSITGITLIAGFANTIGWPLSALFLHELGWRSSCLMWAGLNMLLAAPVNWLTIPRRGMPQALREVKKETLTAAAPPAAMPILAFFFAVIWFVQGAMAAHLPGLLKAAGASSAAAIAAASLVGRPKLPPASWSLGYARGIRSHRPGSLPHCIQLAPRSSFGSALPASSLSRCCTVPATA
jgi:hypothetical protein